MARASIPTATPPFPGPSPQDHVGVAAAPPPLSMIRSPVIARRRARQPAWPLPSSCIDFRVSGVASALVPKLAAVDLPKAAHGHVKLAGVGALFVIVAFPHRARAHAHDCLGLGL